MSTTLREANPAATAPLPGAMCPAVVLSHVNKTFRLPLEKAHTLKERALHPFRTRRFDVLHAVDDVSFEIASGEFFGIVGRNGSGKSTLLKCLAGIYQADSGVLDVHGRVSPFIELGVGFNPELTARDNAIINAIMLGLTRKEAEERFKEIVAFAELEEFMDLKLKNYSSGMMVRLAFSVAIQVDADIVLIDEVLAVGDASFQQKCFDQFARLKAAGRTILFVTHDMGSVERFCDRAMLLERGRMVDVGEPSSITRQYNELNFRRVREEAREHDGPEVLKRAPVAEILTATFESPDGDPLVATEQGAECAIRMDVRFHADVDDPLFSFSLRNDLGQTVFATATQIRYGATGHFRAGEVVSVRLRFQNWLAPNRYALTAAVSRDGIGADAFDLRLDLCSMIVHSTSSGGGIADLPHTFEIDRG